MFRTLIVMLIAACFGMSLPSASAQTAILKDAATPVKEKPSQASPLIATLASGDTVRFLMMSGPWVKIAFHGKREGWMFIGARPAPDEAPQASVSNGGATTSATPPHPPPARGPAPVPGIPSTDGGLSFHLGSFSGDFTYVGKFYYRSMPALYLEGTFQYVAGDIASLYLMYGNLKYVRPIGQRFDGTLTAGVGVINTIPIQSAGSKSASNMAINYGAGLQRHLKNNNWLRIDLRQYLALLKRNGTATFLEFTVGIAIGIQWSKI